MWHYIPKESCQSNTTTVVEVEKGTDHEELSTQSVVQVEAPIKVGSAASQEFDELNRYQLIC